MTSKRITPDTIVVVQRTVTVSTARTVAELAEMSGEDLADVVQSLNDRAGREWINLYHVPEMVPEFDRASEADGDTLDSDVWRVVVAPDV